MALDNPVVERFLEDFRCGPTLLDSDFQPVHGYGNWDDGQMKGSPPEPRWIDVSVSEKVASADRPCQTISDGSDRYTTAIRGRNPCQRQRHFARFAESVRKRSTRSICRPRPLEGAVTKGGTDATSSRRSHGPGGSVS